MRPRELQIEGLVQAKDTEVGQHATLGGAVATELGVGGGDKPDVVGELALQEVGGVLARDRDQAQVA